MNLMQVGMIILAGFNILAIIVAIIWGISKCCINEGEVKNVEKENGEKYNYRPPFDSNRKPTGSILKPNSSVSVVFDGNGNKIDDSNQVKCSKKISCSTLNSKSKVDKKTSFEDSLYARSLEEDDFLYEDPLFP